MACDPIQMKQQNLSILRNIFLQEHSATKPQLAKLSRLSVVTVNALLHELMEGNEVFEDKTVSSNGGRPALLYRYNEHFKLALVIYMHVQNHEEQLFIKVQDMFQKTIYSESMFVQDLDIPSFLQKMDEIMNVYPKIAVIVFGIPGTVHNGIVSKMDYEIFQSQELFDSLHTAYTIPIVIENDVNTSLLGYCHEHSSIQECTAAIFFPENYPPGCAICIHGEIFHGARGMAGEIDQLPLGIDWMKEDKHVDELLSNMERTMRSVVCMFDPLELVLYCDFISQEQWNQLLLMIQKTWKNLIPPKMTLRTIHEDFSLGISQLARYELQKQV